MMTALSSEDQRKRGEELGADLYLVKSQVGIEDVVRSVHQVLQDTPSTQQSAAQQPAPVVAPTPQPAPAGQIQYSTPSNVAPQPRTEISTPQQQPTPAATPTATPLQPQAVASQTIPPLPQSAPGVLPQPTAPFSTPRPGTTPTLANRVIEPIAQTEQEGSSSLQEQLAKELEGSVSSNGQQATAPDSSPLPPQPASQPAQQAPPISNNSTPPTPQQQASSPQASQQNQVPQPTTTSSQSSGLSFEETPQSPPTQPAA